MRKILAISLLFGIWAAPAYAQSKSMEYVANQGIGFSREDDKTHVVTAYDLVAAQDDDTIVVANCANKATLKGVDWCFASPENLKKFNAATEERTFAATGEKSVRNKYLPFGGGYCARGLSNGQYAAGDPRTAIMMGEDLILNGSMSVRADFLDDASARRSGARVFHRLSMRTGLLVKNEVPVR